MLIKVSLICLLANQVAGCVHLSGFLEMMRIQILRFGLLLAYVTILTSE